MTTKEFIQYANERPELCEKLAVCTTPEEVYAIATAEGLTDSLEEMKKVATEIKNSMELSEADLDKISAAGTTLDVSVSVSSSIYITVTVVVLATL